MEKRNGSEKEGERGKEKLCEKDKRKKVVERK